MPYESLFATIATIATTIAGFSGIVLTLGSAGEQLGPTGRYRFAILMVNALGATFLALLPSVLLNFGVEGSDAIRASNLAMGVIVWTFLLAWMRASRTTMRLNPDIFDMRTYRTLAAMHVANVALQLLAGFGIVPGPGAYAVGLFTILAHATNQFVRMLFRPLGAGR